MFSGTLPVTKVAFLHAYGYIQIDSDWDKYLLPASRKLRVDVTQYRQEWKSTHESAREAFTAVTVIDQQRVYNCCCSRIPVVKK
jgi:hypothetical protein